MKTPMGWWYEMLKKSKPYEDPFVREDEYTVREGDTPESVAKEYLDDPAAYTLILSWNKITKDEFVPGLKIYFPKFKY